MSSLQLRILHYVPAVRLEQGGVVRSILDWCTIFAARRHAMSLAVYEEKDVPPAWLTPQPDQPHAFILPTPRPPFKLLNRQALQKMDELLANADVLHLHGPWLDGNRQIAKLARSRGIPYVVSTHGTLNDWAMTHRGLKKRLYLALSGRRLMNRASMVHFTAAAEMSQATRWFSNPNATILPYLVDLTPFVNLPGPQSAIKRFPQLAHDVPRLLFLSRLHEQKGVDIFIRAAGLLRDAGIQFVAILAGNGEPAYQQYLKSIAAELNLQDHLIFTGLVVGEEKLSLYSAADLFVLPTRHENFGLVLTEAMACGLPIVTTKGTDIWQEIQKAGAIIADATPAAFAREIQKLLANSVDTAARAKQGQDWVFANLDIESLSQKYEAMYRQLIKVPA